MRHLHLILDWDGTLTKKDTIAVLAEIAYQHKTNLPPWQTFVDAWSTDFITHRKSYKPKKEDRQSVAEEIAWLRSLAGVERRSIERIEKSLVFAELDQTHISQKAAQVGKAILRLGWLFIIEKVLDSGGQVSILSVNWSAFFILSCLKSAAPESGSVLDKISIFSNEFVGLVDDGVTNGKLTRYQPQENRGIWTSDDKLRIMHDRISQDPDLLSMYIGDSLTDLECLLAADFGVVIQDNVLSKTSGELVEALARLKIPLHHVDKYKSQSRNGLWLAEDFERIASCQLFDEVCGL